MDGCLLGARGGLCVAAAACLCLILVGCQSSSVKPAAESVQVSPDITVRPAAEGVWVYTAYFDLPSYGRTAANGLVVIDGQDAMLIDLPWTDEQTGVLFDWASKNFGATVKTVVPTHFHQDCMGGLAEAHRRGAASYAQDRTVEIAREKNLPVPQVPFRLQTMVRCGRTVALARYFGPGHTTDNIVVWFPVQKILFGGCLIKSMDAESLGNTADGDLQAYPQTLGKVKAAYPNAKIVVPGHGDWGGPELIDHTIKLCAPKDSKP
ncbi:MAG: subclass B1 metallo-beta-lactamase [Phycisphaerales bacterium]